MLSMPTALPLIRASHLNFIINSMRDLPLAIPVESLLEAVGINSEQLNTPDKLMLETKVWHFLTLAAELQQMPHLGFYIFESTRSFDSHTFFKQLLGAANLFQALQLLINKVGAYNNNNVLWLKESEEYVWICRSHYPKSKHGVWQAEQITMGLICMLIEHYAGSSWSPKYVKFQDRDAEGTDQSRFFKHTKIKLGHRYSAIAIEHALLINRDVGDDPLTGYPLNEIPDSFTQAFKLLLKENYFGQEWLAEDIAATLEMSVRTLKRKLQSQGTSLREVFDEVRFQQACDLIEQGIHDYTTLARKLSYTHPNNFVRAFKRWNGTTPREYIRLRQVQLINSDNLEK